jgi:hypothetical protein
LKPEEHDQLLFRMASHAPGGDEILGTDGIRTVRCCRARRFTSGSVRVISPFYDRERIS